VAARTLEQNQDLMEQRLLVEAQLMAERERAARAERHAEELRYVLTQHQRALAEAAESLAEERARAQAAEQAAAQAIAVPEEVIVLPEQGPSRLSPPAARSGGWGGRLRRWLWGERAG